MAPMRGRGRGKAKGKGKRKGKNDWELEAAPVADDHSNGQSRNRKCHCNALNDATMHVYCIGDAC